MTIAAHITNKPYDQIAVGDEAELHRICTDDDFYVFANASGNHNPMHLSEYEKEHDFDGDGQHNVAAPGMWIGSLVSAVLGNLLPGAGTRYKGQSLTFHRPAYSGDELIVHAKVLEKGEDREVRLATTVRRKSDNALIVSGEAVVQAPDRKFSFSSLEVPGLVVQRHRHFEALLGEAEPLPPIPTAVVSPEEPRSLGGALLAGQHTIIRPILIGDPAKIKTAAEEIGESLDGIEIIDAPEHSAAAHRAVDEVADGRANAVMKGHLHTDDLLHACLRKERGLRSGRRFTHVAVMDVPGLSHPLIVSDAAINISPDISTKMDIVQNAIDVARAIGIDAPKVGVLSAVETVNPQIQSSVDAALLSKMAERGQIRGASVDGPLAMDNAVDLGAARTKGIKSDVAGRAEVLIVPNIDAGNMLIKQLAYISHAEMAGLVMGASVPIILNSRSDDDMARLASCAVAAMYCVYKGELQR